MDNLYTIPSTKELKEAVERTPMHMWPSSTPYVVVQPGALSTRQCDDILYIMNVIAPYKFPHCPAETTEALKPLHQFLEPIRAFGIVANHNHFRYSLSKEVDAWMQRYEDGNSYPLHMDATPGQTRKMTVVALLTHPQDYDGGILQVTVPPMTFSIPKRQGTMIAFPSWLLHQVLRVTGGMRQTINMGFYGPPWK